MMKFPPRTPDEIEAFSRRYSDSVLRVLPLASGRLAVFDNGGQLVEVREEIPNWEELRQLVHEAEERFRLLRESTTPRPRLVPAREDGGRKSEKSAEDLGL